MSGRVAPGVHIVDEMSRASNCLAWSLFTIRVTLISWKGCQSSPVGWACVEHGDTSTSKENGQIALCETFLYDNNLISFSL